MKKKISILPCPFCGMAGEVNTLGEWSGVGCRTQVRLGVMCFGYRHALQYRSPDEAISAWNARAVISAAPYALIGASCADDSEFRRLTKEWALSITLPCGTECWRALCRYIDSRPRSEDSRAMKVLEAMNHMGGDERGGYCICPLNDGSAPDHKHATICADARRALASTTPQKANDE